MSCWLSIFILATAVVATAQERSSPLAAAGMAEFNAAYQAWDGARFAVAAELFARASANAPGSPLLHYWVGVAHFHRMLQLESLPATRARRLTAEAAMEDALAALSNAVKPGERDAETHALLGTLYGMKINGNLLRAARLGPRVQTHRKRAMEFGLNNPRVLYLLGTCQFHTAGKPAARREALATLLKAEERFVAEARRLPRPLEPRWGWSTCLTFIGRTCEELGQNAEAASYFRDALARHPADHLAAEGLARVTVKP